MKKITTTTSVFEDMRTQSILYVDKTDYIWKMVDSGSSSYFLSRPRRFGKSLTVSTLKALFEGKRELFKGLAIDNAPYDWKAFPVIHLDLGNCCSHSAEELREFLLNELKECMDDLDIQADLSALSLSVSFSRLIRELHSKRGPVVILIDEYDKPLLENLTSTTATEIRDVLSDFYSTLKKEDACERFVFLTGVTKFCQVSIFSKLNNLKDVSMDADYATMLGYTQNELEANFSEWIADAEARQPLPHDQFMIKIKEWYDGFRFEANAESVYNPVSIASFFDKHGTFSNYWFSTGTPSFLLDLLKSTDYDLEKTLKMPVDELAFSAYEVENLDPLTLLLQTGYLTIKSSMEKHGRTMYSLDFPNLEVKRAFDAYLLNAYTGIRKQNLGELLDNLLDYLEEGQTDDAIDVLKTFFASIPYDIQLSHEKYYQSILFVLFLTLGTMANAEARTNRERIDAVVAFSKHIYILEFKINTPVSEAMTQIRDREYYQRYRHNGKQIHLLGITISTKKRQITEWEECIEQ